MPTIIDELIVRLGFKNEMGAQAPGVKKNLDDIGKSAQGAESGVKKIGDTSKDTAGELSALSGKLGAFLALIGGTVALKTFIRDAIETNTQLYFLSRNLGLSAQSISAWGTASEELGGSAKGLQATLAMLSQEQTKLRMGTSALLPYFSAMGVSMAGTPMDMMRGLNAWAQGKDRAFAHNILAQMGFDEGDVNLMLQTTAAFNEMIAAAKKFAATDAENAHAKEMNKQLVLMEMQFKKIGIDLLERATPYLEKFMDLLQRFGAWVQEHEEIAAVFTGIGIALGGVAAVAGVLGIALPALEAGFAVLTGPLGLVVAAIGLLGLGFVSLLDDYENWKSGGASKYDWTDLAHRIHVVGEAVDYLGDKFDKATDAYKKWLVAHGLTNENIDYPIEHFVGNILGVHHAGAVPDVVQKTLQGISAQEGFDKPGSIPQRANNPGDIEYGKFALNHGAIPDKYIMAEGGHLIAVFPDVGTGKAAALALLQSKKYAGMSVSDALNKWSGGAPGYVAGALKASGLSPHTILPGPTSILAPAPSAAAALHPDFWHQLWNGLKNAAAANTIGMLNSIPSGPRSPAGGKNTTVHVGEIHIHTQATDAKGIAAALGRGTDWLTFATQANSTSR